MRKVATIKISRWIVVENKDKNIENIKHRMRYAGTLPIARE